MRRCCCRLALPSLPSMNYGPPEASLPLMRRGCCSLFPPAPQPLYILFVGDTPRMKQKVNWRDPLAPRFVSQSHGKSAYIPTCKKSAGLEKWKIRLPSCPPDRGNSDLQLKPPHFVERHTLTPSNSLFPWKKLEVQSSINMSCNSASKLGCNGAGKT